MRVKLSIFLGKIISLFSERLSLGAGGTWPGEVALALNPNIFQFFASRFTKGIILVAGTNGKTTTSLMIKKVLESDQERVVHNDSGANLLNGIVSACIKNASWSGSFQADYGVFEVDENTLPEVLRNLDEYSSREESSTSREVRFKKFSTSSNNKLIIVLLNLFRDQLDRYGEVDVIAEKWEKALRRPDNHRNSSGRVDRFVDTHSGLARNFQIIANADDPLVAHLGKAVSSRPGLEARVHYFGVTDKTKYIPNLEHATDSIFCLNCGARLEYEGIYFSHIGIWKCTKCGEKRPTPDVSAWKSPLPGLYNTYNTLATVSVVKSLGYMDQAINTALAGFTPAFGRQEEFEIDGPTTSGQAGFRGVNKKVKIFLSKNPAGFNESLKTVLELGATQLLLVLNDRIPDGRDVSWIWDVDFEMLPFHITPVVSGDRAYDMALRLKYAKPFHKIPKGAVSETRTPILVYEDLKTALELCLTNPNKKETLYILATYSAMLDVRKILTGKKIL